MQTKRYADLIATPWKNGGGVTREITRLDENGALIWRLSIADVASEGPFSTFSGLQRILTVIDGAGMVLARPDKTSIPANLFEPVAFSGDEPINGLLPNGACRDFNVIWNPDFASTSVTILRGSTSRLNAPSAGITGLLCLVGSARTANGEQLTHLDFVLLDAQGDWVDLSEGDVALLVSITPRSKA